MRHRWCGFSLLLPLLLGCSGKNVVAGEEKTKAEQLDSTLTSWCQSTCTRLRACPAVPCQCDTAGDVCNCVGVDDNCEVQCARSFDGYTDAGEGCAAVGQRYQKCIDGLTCSDLDNRHDPCRISAAERAACPDPDENVDVYPNGDGGDSTGPSSGGTSSAGPSAGQGTFTAGSASIPGPVSCSGSYGTGGGAPASGGSQVTCEEGRLACTDGHDYSWICARDSQGRRACSCLVDAHATAGFEPVKDCPDLTAVNAGCGWSLLP